VPIISEASHVAASNGLGIYAQSDTITALVNALIISLLLDYCNSFLVWCPYKKGDIEEIEKIQKRATKLIISLKKSYHTKNDFLN